MNIKIKKYLLILISIFSFFEVSYSQNTFNFELTYVDVNGDVNGIIGENIVIPVQAIFFQEEGQCEGETGPCSAFIVNSLDPTIDIDNTIREIQNVTFTDPSFGFTNLNNDFSGNGSIGFEDLLTDYEIWPPNSSITNCQYTPVPGSDSFLASNICKDDVINLTNNIGQFVVELVATFPTDCDDAPADGINDNQAFWFLHFNLYFPDEIEITSNSSESCGFNTSCAGENDGEITAIVSGGVPPYSYVWTNDSGTIISNSNTATDLTAGFYTVTVTDDQNDLIFDSNGDGSGVVCSETFEITEPDPIDISLSASESNLTLDCAGDSDGSIFVNVTGGCEPYNYSWSNGTTDEAAENLTADTYTLTLTDSNGCVVIFSQEITEPNPILVVKNEETSVDSDGCADLGAIDIEVSGGTPFIADPEYNYLWQTDSDGDGVGDSFFSNNEDISNLGANIYYLTVTDALGCEFNTSYIITWPGPFTVLIEETSKLDLDCFGDCDGSINIVPGGGSGNYSYLWTAISGEIPAGQENNQNLNGLCAGSYLVTLTDIDFPDCVWNQLIEITEPEEELTISLVDSKLELDCFSDCDGFIDINVSGGTGLYLFDWSNSESTEDISELCAGNYEIIVTDENGCIASQSFEITEPSAPLSLNFVKNDNTCFGSCQGEIDITVNGGTPPYNYSWSNGSNDEDIIDLCTGTYILSVTDDNGCEISGNYEITEPEEIIISGELSDYNGYPVSCYLATDGTINITVTGGSGSYTYLWEAIPGFLDPEIDNTTEDLVGLGVSFYTVIVTDENDPTCTATSTFEIFEPVPFEVGIDEVGQVNCNNSCDGFINITAYGGANVDLGDLIPGEEIPAGDPNTYTYNWTGPDGFNSNEADISGLCPGIYTVTVTDINGCIECALPYDIDEDDLTITCDIVITEPDELITTVDITPPACSGYPGCITLNSIGGTGAYNYSFYEDNGNLGPNEDCTPETEDILFEPTISEGCFDIVSGDYYVITTDENGCCTVNNFTVSNADEVSVDINEVPDCYPNESMLVLSGWTPPNETYTIVIFDNDTDNDGLDNINNNNNPLDSDINNINGDNSIDPDIDGDGILNENDYIDVDGNGVFNTGDVNTEYLFSNPPLYDFVYDQQEDILCGDFLGGIWDGNGTGSGTCNEFPLLYDGGATVVLIIAESGCFNFQLVSNDNDIYLPIETTNEILSPNCSGENDVFEFENNDIDGDGVYDDDGNCISSCNDDDPDVDGDGIPNSEDDDANGDGCLDDGTYSNEECQTCGCSGEITINILEDEDYTPNYTVYVSSLIYAPDGQLIYLSPNSDADDFDIDGSYNWLNLGDPDDDNDGLFDYEDEFPFDSNNDGIDDCIGPAYDCDNDGVLDNDDPDQDNDGILNDDDNLFSLSNLIDNNFITTYSEADGNLTVSDSDGDGLIDQLNLTNLCTGEYLYVVQDANGCESLPVVFDVEEVNELIVDVNTGAEPAVICFGDCTGFIDLTVSGGTPFGPGGPDGIEGNEDDGQPYIFDWSNGEVTEDVSDLCNGTYSVTVTDANGCCEIIERTIVESPIIEVVLTSGTELSCFGDCNGEIQIDVTGGTEPYIFNWTGPDGFSSTDEDLLGLCAGTYTLNGIDSTIGVNGEGCDFIFEVIITEPEELIISNSLLSIYECDYNVSCFGSCDGSIDVTVSGGNTPYTYEWINIDTGEFLLNIDLDGDGENDDVSSLCAGTYQLTVIDNNTECESIVETFIITEPNELNYSLEITEITCFGSNDGKICLDISGGCEPYQYDISDSEGNNILNESIVEVTEYCVSDLGPDTYTITISDTGGCNEFIETITLNEPTEINATLLESSFTELNCFGDCNGSLEIDVFGGIGFEEDGIVDGSLDGVDDDCVSYLWTADLDGDGIEEFTSSELNLNNLCAGSYTLLATDCNGCENTFTYDITQPEELSATFDVVGACFDDPNGSIDMTIIGGTPNYNISWDNGAITEDISDLTPGDYTVIITDENTCIYTETVTIDSSSEITIEINETNENLLCFGDCNGFIDVTSTGGEGILNYEWTATNGFSSNSEDIFDLCAGSYTLTVTDENNCDTSITIEISEPEEIIIELINQENLTCNSICTGSIDISVLGGVGTYTYLWNNGAITEDISNLCAGDYSITVTDENLCESLFEITISEPDPLLVETDLLQNILCNYCDESGSILEATDEGRISLSVSGESNPYSFDVYDDSGVIVFSGTTTGNTIFQTDEPGSYYFEVTDANGCNTITTEPIEITEPTPMCITDVEITNSSCFSFEFNDGSISINVEGGTPIEFGLEEYNYVWSSTGGTPGPFPNSSTINELSAGNYSVVVTDANECEIISEIFEIDEPDPIDLDICYDEFVCCGNSNGTIVATVNGGVPIYIYTLFDESLVEIGSNNVGLFNGLTAGVYTLTVTDQNWTDEISLIDPLACAALETITINESCPQIELVSEEDAGCSDEANVIISVLGGVPPYTLYVDGIEEDIIIFDNPAYNLSLNSGNHDIYIIDSNLDLTNDCSENLDPCESETININIDAIPVVFEIQEIIINQPPCPGSDGSMVITANGSEPPLSSNEANFEIGLDTNGDGNLSLFEVEGAYTDTWSPIEPNYTFVVPYIESGNYLYNSFDYFDCIVSGDFDVIEPIDLDFNNFFTSVDADCNGASGSAYVSTEDIIGGTAPYNVTWYEYDEFGALNEDPSGTGNANALYAGDYLVVITDFNECEYEHNFTINEPEEILLANLEVYDPTCYNDGFCTGSVTANPTGGQGSGYTLTWYDSNDNIIISGVTTSLNNLCEGDYYVILNDGVCNPIQVEFSINSPDEIIIEISTEILCNGDLIDWDLENNYINISGGTNPIDIWWFDNNVDSTNEPILVYDINGNIILNTNALDIDQDGVLNIDDNDDDGDGIDDVLESDPMGFGNGSGFFWSVLPSNNLDPIISDNGYSISINNLSAGNYYLYILDSNGCFQEMLFEITEPEQLEVSWNESDLDLFIDCYGANNGSIGIIIEGGTAIDDDSWPFPYYYTNWININGSSIINSQEISMDDLEPGTYIISVEDANGCTVETDPIEITQADPLTVSETTSEYNCNYNISCFGANDGSIDLNVNGGITPYNYDWIGPNGFTSSSENISGLSAGSYTVTITSNVSTEELTNDDGEINEGCVQILTIELTEPEELILESNSSNYDGFGVSCNGATNGFINLSIDGGCQPYTFNWTGPFGGAGTEEDVSDLGAGIYSVSVTDNNGCSINTEIEITEPLPIIFDSISGIDTTPASCKDGNSSDGTITIDTSEISGGISPYNITLNETNETISSTSSEFIIFENLSWDYDNDGNIDSYSITITDSNGCNITEQPIFITYETGTFTVLPSPLYNINPTCEDNTDGSLLIGAIEGGDLPYTLNWTSTNGFTGSYIWTLDGISPDNILAGGTPGDIDGDGIYNYADNNIDGDAYENDDPLELDIDGDGIQNDLDLLPYGNGTELGGNLASGTYYLTVEDNNGCISEYTYTLESDSPTFSSELSDYNGFNISCGENNFNCESSETNGFITIDEISFDHFNTSLLFWPNYEAYPIDVYFNENLIATLDSESDLPYQITNLDPTIIGGNIISDPHEIILIDSNGCEIISNNLSIVDANGLFDMDAPEPLDISLSTGSCPECQDAEDGFIEINVIGGVGGYNFYFDSNNDGVIIYNNDLDGDCIDNFVKCTKLILDKDIDGDGILNFDPDIDGDGILNFIIDIDFDGILNENDLDIDGDGINNCDEWFNGDTPLGNNQIEDEINGFTFTVVYLDNDIDGDGVNNLNDSTPYGADNEDSDGDGILNYDPNMTNNIVGEGTDGSLIIDNLSYGNYLIGVSDANGCISETNINISNDICENQVFDWENCLFIPSVFTPNMDGVNDFWEIYNIEIYEPEIILTVYNRWGQVVFDIEGIYNENLWNGNNQSNGSPLEIGAYYYTLELKKYNKTYNGTITIKR